MRKIFFLFFVALFAQFAMATTYYVKPSGNDANNGLSSSTAFQTIQHAVEVVAANGDPATDKVILLDGSWPSTSTITSITACTQWTTNLVLEGEHSNVLVNKLVIYCQHLTFRGFKITGVSHEWGGDNVTLEDLIGVGKTYWNINASNITWRGCQATDNFTETGDLIRLAASGNIPERVPTNILFEDCCFRGSSTPDGNHIDVIQSIGSVNFTMRNCKIYHVPTGLFMPTKVGSVPLTGFLFENCYFFDGRLYTGHNNDNFVVKNCVIEATIDYTQQAAYKPYHEWRGNKIRSWGAAVDEMPTVFEDNIVQSTTHVLPPSNIIDPNLVLIEPDCPSRVVPDGISVAPTTLELAVNESAGLIATVTPSNASQSVLWTSSDYSVADVDQNGVVTAVSTGTAIIKVETTHSDLIGNQFEATCAVNVITDNNPPTIPTGLSVSGTTYSSVTLHYNASTDDRTVAGYKVYTNGSNPVTVTNTNPTITGLNAETTYSFTVSAIDGSGNESGQSSQVSATTGALPDVESNATWQTFTESVQTGSFTASFNAIPSVANMDAITGILNGTAGAYGDLACIIRFNPSGQIDARNGGVYASSNTVNYTPGINYFFEVDINIPSHTYSVYATPEGGSKQTVASNFAFRTEQAAVTQLNAWAVYATLGSHSVDGMTFGAQVIDTEAPSTPTALSSGTITSSSVALSWNASTDNVGVTGYKVYTNGANPVTVAGTSATINGLTASTTYNFSVSAIDASGNESAQSASIQAITEDIIITGGYYCDPVNGSMTNDGSQSSPWSTLEAVFAAGKTFVAGDIIYLLNGNHGGVTISGNNSGDVTITAAQGENPEVDYIYFVSASRWIISNIEFSPDFTPVSPNNYFVKMDINSSYNTIENCNMFSVFNLNSATEWNSKPWSGFDIDGPNNTIRGNNLQNIRWGFRVDYTATNTLGEYNVIENLSYDGIQSLASYCTYQYNTIKNVYEIDGNHDDFFQCYSYDGSNVGTTTVYGCVLRGNTFISFTDPNQFDKSDCQGIGNFDGFYEDWIVENNVLILDHWHGITFLGARDCKIVNNTVVKNSINAHGMTPWIMVKHHKDQTPSDGMIVSNNISPDYDLDFIGTNSVITNNITTSDYTAYFVDYANNDLHLKVGSPAIDAGTSVNAPSIDFDGISRPQGSGYDVGAYEYSGAIVPVTGVTVSPTTLSLDEGLTSDLTETVSPANATNKTVSWSSSNTSIATVDANGLVTAITEGTATITVTTNDGNFTANCSVTVTSSGGATPTNVALNKPVSVESEYNATYVAANAVDGNNVDNASRWISADVPDWIEIDLQGTYDVTAINFWTGYGGYNKPTNDYQLQYWDGSAWVDIVNVTGNSSSVVTHNFTAVTTDKIRMYATVSTDNLVRLYEIQVMGVLSDNNPVTGVTVSPTTLTLDEGQTSDLTETVNPSNATDQSVTWSSNNTSVATVDANGLVTAISAGNAIITVTTNDGSFTAACDVTVNVPVIGVSLVPTTLTLEEGECADLTETVSPSNATDNSVTWTSNNTSVAIIDANGLVCGVSAGNATITVTTNDGGYTATCDVTVNVPVIPVTGVSVSPTTLTLDEGQTSQLTETVSPANVTDQSVTWSSNNTSIATVDASGLVTAIAEGSTTITVTTNDGGFTANCTVNVTVPVTGVSLSATTLDLDEGQTADLDETVAPANATDKSVIWNSNNTSIATVDASGLVIAIAEGSATITVTTNDGGYMATCAVTVNSISVETNLALNKPITVSAYQDDSFGYKPGENLVDGDVSDDARWSASGFPQWAEIDLGANYDLNQIDLYPYQDRAYQYIVEAKPDGGSYTTIVDKSSNTESADLLVSPVSTTARYVKITVSGAYGYSGSWVSLAELEVWGTPPTTTPVTGVSLSASTLNLDAGQTSDLDETVSPVDATDKSVTWSSNNSSVATVDANGLVTAVSAGSATITVTTVDGGFTANCSVTVTVPVTGVTLSSSTLNLDAGQTSDLTETVSPVDATDKTVTWSSNNTSVATVDANGLVIAVSAGSATITVTTNDGSFTANCSVTVTVPVNSITISPTSLTLDEGSTGNLATTVLPANATDPSITWSSSDENIATVDITGTVTAIAEGSCNIVATSVSNPAVNAICPVTVNGIVYNEYTLTINGSNADRQIQSNEGLGSTSNQLHRVGGSTGTLDGCAVHPFELPALGAGEIVVSASFSVGLEKIANNPTGNVDLYGIPYRSTEDVIGSDYYQGVFNGNAGNTGIQDDFATLATPEPSVVSTSVAAETVLANYINAQYDAGAVAGNYIFLRINPDANDVQSYYYWNFYSAEASNASDRPTLELFISNNPIYKNVVISENQAGQNNNDAIKIYPNPLNGNTLHIQLNNGYTKDMVNVNIFDLTGRKIYNQLYETQTELQIPMDNLSKGIYIISVNGEQQKLVVE